MKGERQNYRNYFQIYLSFAPYIGDNAEYGKHILDVLKRDMDRFPLSARSSDANEDHPLRVYDVKVEAVIILCHIWQQLSNDLTEPASYLSNAIFFLYQKRNEFQMFYPPILKTNDTNDKKVDRKDIQTFLTRDTTPLFQKKTEAQVLMEMVLYYLHQKAELLRIAYDSAKGKNAVKTAEALFPCKENTLIDESIFQMLDQLQSEIDPDLVMALCNFLHYSFRALSLLWFAFSFAYFSQWFFFMNYY